MFLIRTRRVGGIGVFLIFYEKKKKGEKALAFSTGFLFYWLYLSNSDRTLAL